MTVQPEFGGCRPDFLARPPHCYFVQKDRIEPSSIRHHIYHHIGPRKICFGGGDS
jgi:hypothetical protein